MGRGRPWVRRREAVSHFQRARFCGRHTSRQIRTLLRKPEVCERHGVGSRGGGVPLFLRPGGASPPEDLLRATSDSLLSVYGVPGPVLRAHVLVHIIATLAASLSPRFLGDEAEACEPATCAAGAGRGVDPGSGVAPEPGGPGSGGGDTQPRGRGPPRGPRACSGTSERRLREGAGLGC